jgi:uncharacterized protein (TIGR00369 family)
MPARIAGIHNCRGGWMQIKNNDYRSIIETGFKGAPFINLIGMRLTDCGPGWCETELSVASHHLQQNGYVHAGVLTTIADHSSGGAASTIIGADEYVITLEFKLNLLRAASGEKLRCRSQVLRAGGSFTVVESEIYSMNQDKAILSAKGIFTMAVLKK